MKELQQFAKQLQEELHYQIKDEDYATSKTSLLMNQMLLTTEVAEVAELLRELFEKTDRLIANGMGEDEAFAMVKAEITEELGKEISDCIAYLTKLSNFFGRDMETDFYGKMEEVRERVKQ